jgi:hypothetical protein
MAAEKMLEEAHIFKPAPEMQSFAERLVHIAAMEVVAGRGGAQSSKLSVLIRNTTHNTEMNGYISVYMRLKGVVPTCQRPPDVIAPVI